MTWKALLAQVKDVPAGGYVGYGRTWRAQRRTRIAVIPVGYFEGYSRALSSRAHVLVRGQRAPVLGRVCMNMFMVDVTDVPDAAAGDVAVLLGRDGEESVSAEALAGWAGTIHYEITTRVNPLLPAHRGLTYFTQGDTALNSGVAAWWSRSKMAVSAVVTTAPACRHRSSPRTRCSSVRLDTASAQTCTS